MHIIFLLIIPILSTAVPDVTFVILSQKAEYDSRYANELERSIQKQAKSLEISANTWIVKGDQPDQWGYWGILSIAKQLKEKFSKTEWFLILNPYSKVVLSKLLDFLETKTATEHVYFGYDVNDERPTITHHYYGFEDEEEPFFYPDLSSGILISYGLMESISDSLEKKEAAIWQFSIDAGHEFAKFLYTYFKISVIGAQGTFCSEYRANCAVYFEEPKYDCASTLKKENVKVYVKTFSGFHKTRVPIIQSTWAAHFDSIEYVSDVISDYPKTISVGVNNTNKGHCVKTFGILGRFLSPTDESFQWLLIADDDTLLSPDRLIKLLRCYDHTERVIIGERYGFGFGHDGYVGYDYPTGGSGMIFSREAVEKLVKECRCPSISSPDDMVIGMCARAYKIPIYHSAAFHQAQFLDYPTVYLSKLKPISFHKYTNVDPIWVYQNYLVDNEEHEEL